MTCAWWGARHQGSGEKTQFRECTIASANRTRSEHPEGEDGCWRMIQRDWRRLKDQRHWPIY